jgi:CubicO group peptidase (beta-lactamase class C family)
MRPNRFPSLVGARGIIALAVLALVEPRPGIAFAQPPSGSTQVQPPRRATSDLARRVDSLVRVAIADGIAPGFGLAVVRDGQVILERAYGHADATRGIRASRDTRWYVASTSKSFTGFAMTLLAEGGTLPFATAMDVALPGVSWHPSVRPESLTVARLLSHTHGLNDNLVVVNSAFTGAVPESAWPSLLSAVAPARRQALIYSNFGYNVAGMILDRRSPGGWRRVLDSAVFTPAGMRQTTALLSRVPAEFVARPHRYDERGWATLPFDKRDVTMHAAGGHVATLHDLARWVRVQIDTGVLDGRAVFPAAAVRRGHALIASHTEAAARRFGLFDREGWGAGWDLGTYNGIPMVSRFGGYATMRSHLSFLPARRIGVVAMTNGGLGPSLTDVVAALVYDLDGGDPAAWDRARQRLDSLRARLPEARRRSLGDDALALAQERTLAATSPSTLAGRYQSTTHGVLEIRASNAGLFYRWGVLSGAIRTVDAAAGTFRIAGGGTEFALGFEWDGTPGAAPAVGVRINDVRLARVNTP